MTLNKVHTLKPTTLRGYRTMLTAHLLDTFGDIELRDIKPADIQSFLNANKQLSMNSSRMSYCRRMERIEAAIDLHGATAPSSGMVISPMQQA